MRPRAAVWVWIAVTAMFAGACSGSGRATDGVAGCADASALGREPIHVVTTVAPITSIVAMITSGTGTDVEGIVPEGVNSHTYEPTPGVAAALERADVIFLNGLDLEAPTKSLALANLGDGAVVCELGDEILPESEFIYDFSFPESAGSPTWIAG